MPSKEEIIEAVELLKEECNHNEFCGNCPYSADNGHCVLNLPYSFNLEKIKERGNQC